ncbi:dihydropteroate synthase [Chloroherpeton thalassium ATCC 35110]|uniref:Dihydropteroate synthase n=1 Tax=Chloroherpeton thalassium (strain ATCC 35110 / GB-78) TaxID=517418 RepID=B3QZA9_CHLT3|nr:dihydropteroate synthase [Chloroherpeton thalassium]ACF13802.1 dihydropteroate synthase [Chloroherpeton thalassium ATCC 35110]
MNMLRRDDELQIKENFIFKFHGHRLDFLERPQIMGILNITPDSFSDGGRFVKNGMSQIDVDKAVLEAEQMVQDGADIIDIGGESTRPGSEEVSVAEEIRRTASVIDALARKIHVPISIDTWKSEVAEAALKAGATIVNDISGFHFDENLAPLCARYQVPAILMHIRQKPHDMSWSFNDTTTYRELVAEVKAFLADSLKLAEAHGVTQTILDVGFGFGKNVQGNFELLASLAEFKSFERPLLAGLSRKSFIGQALQNEKNEHVPTHARLFGTVAANTIALMNGANVLRVHDVKAAADAMKIVRATKLAQAK